MIPAEPTTLERFLSGPVRPADKAMPAFEEARWRESVKYDRLAMSAATALYADDVAVWSHKQELALEDFPTLLPPWRFTWVEYPSFTGNERRGLVIQAVPVDEMRPLPGEYGEFYEAAVADARAKEPGIEPGWVVFMHVYIHRGDTIVGNVAAFLLVLDSHGRCIGNRWALYSPSITEEWVLAAASPTLWTLSLLHARNVDAVRAVRAPRSPRRRKDRRAPVIPRQRYHVLRLDVPRRSHGGGRAEGGSVSMHMVAGHFAHYGACCGDRHPARGLLFGRHTGLVWVPAHVRGDELTGTVVTDFAPRVREA